jgi:hypothetical protein
MVSRPAEGGNAASRLTQVKSAALPDRDAAQAKKSPDRPAPEPVSSRQDSLRQRVQGQPMAMVPRVSQSENPSTGLPFPAQRSLIAKKPRKFVALAV